MRRTAALIVGAGPAGTAAAIMLARGGRRPLLIERRDQPHDPVCGGFLGWDALAALRRLGLDPAALGARPIRRLRLIAGRERIDVALPRAAAGLSRRKLDEALLDAAKAAGAEVMLGRAVRGIDPDALAVRLDDGEELGGEALILATGKHEARGAVREVDGRRGAPAVGLRRALPASRALNNALRGYIELHLFDGGYAGLLRQEDGSINLCLSVGRERMAAAGGIEALLAELAATEPALAARLDDAEESAWSAIAGVPYGWRAQSTVPGLFRVGDQSAVIASLAGDGIAIALNSGMAAADAMLAEGAAGAEGFQKRFARRSMLPLISADAIRWLVERPRGRAVVMLLLRHLPWLAPAAARLTRIER